MIADQLHWISLREAQDIVTTVMLTRAYAGPEIIKWLWRKRVRWTFIKVYGVPRVGWSLDQEARALWDYSPHKVLVDYEQGSAHRPVSRPHGWMGPLTVIGIRVAKEDIEAALAVDYPDVVSAPLPLSDNPSLPKLEANSPAAPAKFSPAELEKCFRKIMRERKNDPPSEEWMWAEVNRRLKVHVTRQAVRDLWESIAPQWKLPKGRPAKNSKSP